MANTINTELLKKAATEVFNEYEKEMDAVAKMSPKEIVGYYAAKASVNSPTP